MRFATLFLLTLILFVTIPAVGIASPNAGTVVYVKLQPTGNELDAPRAAVAERPEVMAMEAAVPATNAPMFEALGQWQRVIVEPGTDLDAFLADLSQLPGVEVAERQPVRELCVLPGAEREIADRPNDPLITYQWHLSQVNAFAAWDEAPAATGVKIAILDNGVDIDHKDLRSIIWTNDAEDGGTSNFDDDGNGYVDDIYGWDANDWDGNPDAPSLDPSESPGHGTHCSGIAAAIQNNNVGVAGLARGAQIMAVRVGEGRTIGYAVDGLLYAVINEADVVSMSFAGPVESVFERDIINYAADQGVIILAAAGNENNNSLTYPAAYENVIGVAATGIDNNIASFSNYGWWVQAAAPGVDILSTYIGGYGYSSGTSMATPLVAGLAGMLKGMDPDITREQVLARIQQGAQPVGNAWDKETPVGVIDAWRSALPDRPVVAFKGITVNNADGRIPLAATTSVTFDMELLGGDADQLKISLVSLADFMETNGVYNSTQQEVGSFPAVFQITTYGFTEQGDNPAVLLINADGWRDTLSVRIPVDPPYVTVEGGEMIASVTDFGAIGYWDYVPPIDTRTEGVRLLGDKLGALFHGSVLVADMANVADCIYGTDNQTQFDFRVYDNSHYAKVDAPDDRNMWRCTYTDRYDGSPVGVNVTQTVEGYPDNDDESVIYLTYSIERVIGAPVDMYVGVLCDWDILNLYGNQVHYNSQYRLSYMSGSSYNGGQTRFAGIMALGNETISGVRAINNSNFSYTDSNKLSIIHGGTSQATSSAPDDWANLIAVEVENVGSSIPRTVQFALIMAKTESELLNIASNVASAHQGETVSVGDELPSQFELTRAWPNPFNASTRVDLALDAGADVDIAVYDVLGRIVTTLHRGELTAGSHAFSWNGLTSNGQPVAAGVYIVEAVSGDLHARQKVVLVK
ncbi:S8 family serine peptidase [bacterium]|nr:S8 family serine peptidase [bacterium]